MRKVRWTLFLCSIGIAFAATGCSGTSGPGKADTESEQGLGPEAPSELSPAGGTTIERGAVSLTAAEGPSARLHEFDIDYYDGQTFRDYYEYRSRDRRQPFWPSADDSVYRWRIRAQNGAGWGEWSEYVRFSYGAPTERPGRDDEPDDNADPTDSDDSDGANDGSDDGDTDGSDDDSETDGDDSSTNSGPFDGLRPSDGTRIDSASVTLRANPLNGADVYEFEIDHYDGANWRDYFTYEEATASRTFWPQYQDRAYRWRIRARLGGGWTEWSNWQIFLFGDATAPETDGSDDSDDDDSDDAADPGACGTGSRPAQWTWPTPQTPGVCKSYGISVNYQECGFHTGTDMCGRKGEPIVSMADGEVVYVGPLWLSAPNKGRGPYSVVVKHGPDLYTTYGHNSSASVEAGDCVDRGETIAEMGDRGYSGGDHLHVELIDGTSWTGNWREPFANACQHYADPTDLASP